MTVGLRVSSDQSRSPAGDSVAPTVASSSARTTRRRSFMCTASAAAGSSSERRAWASVGIVVVGVLDPRARGSVDRRRDLELSQRGAEIETGAARDDRCPTRGDQMVDGVVRESGVLADRHRLTEAADPDEVRGLGWLVGQDRQSAVDLERVGGDDVGAERIRDVPCDCRLPRCRRAEDRDHFVRQFGHVSWGTPAHHPLQA